MDFGNLLSITHLESGEFPHYARKNRIRNPIPSAQTLHYEPLKQLSGAWHGQGL
jgi:hypothetical protein